MASDTDIVSGLRKVLQDFLAPEMRTISARLDGIEKVMDERFATIERIVDERFKRSDAIAASNIDSLLRGLKALEDKLDLHARLSKLEASQQSKAS
jgi:hypothetical protein